MTRVGRNNMWNRFKSTIEKIWVVIYLRVISPCLTFLGNSWDKLENWLDKKMDHYHAKRQYLKALYDVDPVARIHRDIKHIKILLIIIMICVLVLELVVIF